MLKKIYYGWFVCAVGMLLIFITMGTVSNGFSVFFPYIMKEQDFTHSQTSMLITLRCLIAFFSMLVVRIYYKKLSMRIGMTIAASFSALAFFIYSFADSYFTFCIGAAISGLSYGLGSMIPVSILMNKWFVKHQALALSICSCGSGLATIFLPPLCTLLVEKFSLQFTFRVEFLIIILITLLIFLVVRSDPSDKGLLPYGYEELAEKAQNKAQDGTQLSKGLSLKMWGIIGSVSLFMGALANPGFSHLSVLFTSEGFNSAIVALLISICGIMLTVGKVIFGQTTDKIGGKRSSVLFLGILLVGHLLCCLSFTGSSVVCIASGILLGLGYPIATIGPSVWSNDLVSQDKYAVTVQRLQIIYAGGALIFSNIPGIIADSLNSYIPAYILFSACNILSLFFVIYAYRSAAHPS